MNEIYKDMTYKEKEGLTISPELIKEADLGKNVFVAVKRHLITIKPKSFTEKIRGVVKDATISLKELDEFYFQKG